MPLKTYTNNNDKQITNTTYSGVVFTNAESKIMQTRFSIAYFNKLMKISIALRNNAGSNDAYATYDTDNQVSVYVSPTKAFMLWHMIKTNLSEPTIHNVCIELKNGLFKISDGSEYGSDNYCFSISYADEAGNVNEVVYETKSSFYTAAYNYNDDKFNTVTFSDMELTMLAMVLEEYYKASSYAVAATVMEANMYKRNAQVELIKAIADKVGVQGGGASKQFNSKTFLQGSNNSNNSSSNTGELNGIPKYYEATTFESIANNM